MFSRVWMLEETKDEDEVFGVDHEVNMYWSRAILPEGTTEQIVDALTNIFRLYKQALNNEHVTIWWISN